MLANLWGWVNGNPYYGPYHIHNGKKKWVGSNTYLPDHMHTSMKQKKRVLPIPSEYRTTSSLSNVSVRENTNLTNIPSNGSPGYSY